MSSVQSQEATMVQVSTEKVTVEGEKKTIFTRLALQGDPKSGNIIGSISLCELLPNPARENTFFESHYNNAVSLTGDKRDIVTALMVKDISDEKLASVKSLLFS